MRSVLGVVAVVFFAACGERPDPPPDDDGGTGTPSWPEGALEIGRNASSGSSSGDVQFEVMPAAVDLTAGAQGGFHVEVMYRVSTQRAADVLFTHKARKADGGVLVSRGSRLFDVGADAGSAWLSEPFPIFMCPTPVGVTVANELVNIEVTATGKDGGLLGRASATTVLRCMAGQYCEVICKG